jgi:Cu/Ag efflux protein CusF
MKRILLVSLSSATLLSQPALAYDAHHPRTGIVIVAQAAAMTGGEVRKVDKAAGKITLKHGPIVNLDMPGMTMVFHVPDAALLEGIKAGDKVEFRAEKVGEDFTVTKMKPLK